MDAKYIIIEALAQKAADLRNECYDSVGEPIQELNQKISDINEILANLNSGKITVEIHSDTAEERHARFDQSVKGFRDFMHKCSSPDYEWVVPKMITEGAHSSQAEPYLRKK